MARAISRLQGIEKIVGLKVLGELKKHDFLSKFGQKGQVRYGPIVFQDVRIK